MDTVQRLTAAFRGQVPDRVPVVGLLALPFVKKYISPGRSVSDLHEQWIENPLDSIVKMQEDLGLDPVVVTKSLHFGEVEVYPRKLLTWPSEALVNWREESRVEERPDSKTVSTTITTPDGNLSYAYRIENYSLWPMEYILKEEKDLDLLKHRPDPNLLEIDRVKTMVTNVGTRGFFTHIVSGVWNEACELRGTIQLFQDIFDRPTWVKELLSTIKDNLKRHINRLAQTGVHSICLNQSWLGMGISRTMYEEFLLPFDREIVQVAQANGVMVSYHNCGRGSHILEQMVSTGAEALETLTPASHSGDFDLAEVKKRVGNRICLFGGFDEGVLLSERPNDVRDEVKRCIDAAAAEGAYILRPVGQLIDARPQNIVIMTETAREYGRY